MSRWIRQSVALISSVVTAAAMSLVAIATPAHAAAPATVKIRLTSTSLDGPGSSVGNGWYHGNAPADNYVKYVVVGQSFTVTYAVTDTSGVAVGAGINVNLAVAKSGAGVANFSGSTSATTDANGVATFSLTNTNIGFDAESYRSNLTTWTDAVGAEYKADFTPSIAGSTATVADLLWTHTVRGSAATPTPTASASSSASSSSTSYACSAGSVNECGLITNLAVSSGGAVQTLTGSAVTVTAGQSITFTYGPNAASANKLLEVALFSASAGLSWTRTGCSDANPVHCLMTLNSSGAGSFTMSFTGNSAGANFKYKITGEAGYSSPVVTATFAGGASSPATPTPTPSLKVTLATADAASTLFKDEAGVATPVGNTFWHDNAPSNNYVKYVEAGSTLTLRYKVTDTAGVSVGAGTTVTLAVAKGGAGVANFTGSLNATTDSSGIATFTLINTNTNDTSEYRRANMNTWSDVPAGTKEYKYDLTPGVANRTVTVADLVWTHIVSTQMATSTPTPNPSNTAPSNGCSGTSEFIANESFSKLTVTGNGTKTGSLLNADNTDLTFRYVDVTKACKTIQVNFYNSSAGLTLGTVTDVNSSTACADGQWVSATNDHGCYIILDFTGTATFHVVVSGTLAGASFQYGLVGPSWNSASTGGEGTITYVGGVTPTATASASVTPSVSPSAVNCGASCVSSITLDSADKGPLTVGNGWWQENAGSNSIAKYVVAGSTLTLHYTVKDGVGNAVSGVQVTLAKGLAATYTGSLVGTTDASGRVIFTLVNTNTDANAESFRSDLTTWSVSTSGVVEGDFVPYITSAGTGGCYSAANSEPASPCGRDRVWTHVVASTLIVVPTPTTSPIFVSFGSGDTVGTTAASQTFGAGVTSEVATSPRGDKALKFVKGAGDIWSGLNFILNGSNKLTGTGKSTITFDYYSPDSVNSPLEVKLMGLGGSPAVRAAVNAVPGWNSVSIDFSTVTASQFGNSAAWSDANVYKSLVIYPDFTDAPDMAAHVENAGQAYYIDNVSINGGTSANGVSDPTPSATPIPTPTPTYSVPGAPTDVAIKVTGPTSVAISWTAPASNGGTAITGYTYIVKNNGVGAAPVTVSDTSAAVSGLVSTGKYSVSVTANNVVGSSAAASSTGTVSPTAIAPGAPTLVSVVRGSLSATVSWTAPSSNGGSVITGYTVSCTAGSTTVSGTGTATGTSAVVTKLVNGTTYTCSVTAKNAKGTSVASSTQTVTPATVPGAPTGAAGVAGNAQVTVNWVAPAVNGGAAVTGYSITVKAGANVLKTVTAAATDRSLVVTGLTNGTAYTFSIVATNSVGNSAAVVSKAVTPSTTPGATTVGTTAQTSATSLTVNWTAPAATGGSAITGYEIKVFSNGAQIGTAKTAAATAKSLVVTGLTTKTAYTFTVAAKNVNGTGLPSTASAAVSTK
jgi:large repetitive protein